MTPVTFSLFEILIIIGISQGLVTSTLLLTNNSGQQSKKILGITILVFCIVNCKVLLHSSGLWNVPHFMYFPVGMELLLPPLVYIYVLSLTKTDFTFSKHYYWHLLPGALYAIYDSLIYLITVGENDIQLKRLISSNWYFDLSNTIEDYLIVILSVVYVVLGYKAIVHYFSWLKQFKQYQTLPIYIWLRNIMFWGALLALVLVVNQLLSALSIAMEEPKYRWRFFNLLVALVTYCIGFMGYKNDSLRIHDSKNSLHAMSNKLGSQQAQNIASQLHTKLVDEALYLESSLTLKQLANILGVTPESLSLIINQKFGMGFRDLINQHRVEHVKQCLKQEAAQRSILDLALASGFNSQASFYRAFKKHEGMSPKAYINSNSQ